MKTAKRMCFSIIATLVLVSLFAIPAYAGSIFVRGETLTVGNLVKAGAGGQAYKTTAVTDAPIGVVVAVNVRGESTHVIVVNTDNAYIDADEAITAGEYITPSSGTAGTVTGEATIQDTSFGIAVADAAAGKVLVRFIDLNPDSDDAAATEYFAITKDNGTLTNGQIHPNTGTPNYDIKHDASDISDFDTEVGNHTDVAANTSARHTQGTDQGLDTGGANAVTAAQTKTAYTHSQLTSGNPHSVTKTNVSLGNVENLKVKLDGTVAPTANDDSGSGYAVGSRWVDITADKEYVCLDSTPTAAVWTETTGAGGGGGGYIAAVEVDNSEVNTSVYRLDFHGVGNGGSSGSGGSLEHDLYASATPIVDGLSFEAGYNTTPNAVKFGGVAVTGTWTNTNHVNLLLLEEATGATTTGTWKSKVWTLYNSPVWTNGKFGCGLDLNGTTHYLELANDTDFDFGAGDYTFFAWVNLDNAASGTTQGVVKKYASGDGYICKVNSSDNFGIELYDSGDTDSVAVYNTAVDVVDEQWHLVGWSFNQTTDVITVSVDSVQQTGSGAAIGAVTVVSTQQIGVHLTNFLDGTIDNVTCIKGVALTAEAFDALYAAGRWWNAGYVNAASGTGLFAVTGSSLSYPVDTNIIAKEQGTFEIGFIPFWDGNDSANHALMDIETASNVNRISLFKTSANDLGLYIYGSAGASIVVSYAVNGTTVPAGAFTHVVGTWQDDNGDGTPEMVLYLNGVNVDDTETGTGKCPILINTTLYVGRDATAQASALSGLIDFVRVYNRPLTGEEVAQNYRATRKEMNW